MTEASPATTEPSLEERGARARHVAGVIARRALIIGACVVLIPAAVYILVAAQPREHRATVIVQPAPLIPPDVVVSSSLVPPAWSASPTPDFVALLAKTPEVRIDAARLLKRSPAELGAIDAKTLKKTGWITIGVRADSSRGAVDAANAVAAATGLDAQVRTRRAVALLTSSLQSQLAKERDPTIRGQIRAQLAAFRAFRPEDARSIQVIAPATGSSPVSNSPGLAAGFALLFALWLGWRLASLAERADDRIHDPDEVGRMVGAFPLAAIPKDNTSPEPFLRLRDSIVHLGVHGRQATIVVTSSRDGDGRTSVAVGLAKAYTAAGLSVVLVDADFRDPQVASRMVVAPTPGLSDVLAGRSLDDALHGGLHAGLTLLPAGEPGKEAADLLGSERMSSVLRELASRFDVVVVDTPPLLAVSDALALVRQATGVLLVSRIDHTSRRGLKRSAQLLRRASANVLGAVVTGTTAGGSRLPSVRPGQADERAVVHAPGG